MVNKKIVGIGVVTVVAVAAIVVIVMLPQGPDTAPVIANPIAPGYPRAGQNIPISVLVEDDKGVSSGILSWSNDSGVEWHNVTMTRTSSSTTQWFGTANIPPQDIEETVQYKIYAQDTAGQSAVQDNAGSGYSLYTGSRKAIIVNGDDKFFNSSSNDDFNSGHDSQFFDLNSGNWTFAVEPNTVSVISGAGGVGGSIGIALRSVAAGDINGNWSLDYDQWYPPLLDQGFYNISAQFMVPDLIQYGSARLGLRWKNASGEVRVDWSIPIPLAPSYVEVDCCGWCDNQSGQEITDLDLLLSVNGTVSGADQGGLFDDIKIQHWISVNATDPVVDPNPPPQQQGADAFPAQALNVYKILKSHGYTDNNLFLMLYNKNNPTIDIHADGIADDLAEGVTLDVANDSVTSTKFKQELNRSIPGSFAAGIQPNDQLIIFMTDHGSNKMLGDGNASFHFAADGGFITEGEFYNLTKDITCWRKLINVDCCFSGNFLNNNSNIGGSWWDLPNTIMVSAAADKLSWYWKNCNNGDGFSGSWMFHPFWDQLNASQTIDTAFTFALNFLPTMVPPAGKVVGAIQTPLMHDNLGIKSTWSFSSFPKL